MKKIIDGILTSLVVIALIVLSLIFSPYGLSDNQKETLLILIIVCGSSILYCFIVGEISRNNSQMDKLWSILPIAYTWIIAIKSGFNPRQLIYAILVSLWGIRLTLNFARKGAYSIKFWSGEEDYRWKILRNKKPLDNKFVWAIFDLLFISFYQNALVLAICLPSFVSMDSVAPIGLADYIAFIGAGLFLLLETIADEIQMRFHTKKRALLSEGKELEDLPSPYNKGFNTVGIWNYSRHPNYLGEQGFWIMLYFVALGANTVNYGFFSWSMIGPLLLVLIFLGSSNLQEKISAGKYPEYSVYVNQVFKYLPIRKYRKG